MRLINTVEEMRRLARGARSEGQRLGLVPTMGALHQGHLSLVARARARSDLVVVSIFVNPTQFGPQEDFARYPRSLENDCALVAKAGIEVVFAPSVEEMYGDGTETWVLVEGMSDRLCGRSRPGHFRGVATVVLKLFHIVEPDFAFFGQKDAAQVAIIRRMVDDLNLAVEIEACPIVREADGLALSSRNAYLSHSERKSALALYRSLCRSKELFDGGERNSAKLVSAGRKEIARESQLRLDYFEIVDPDTLLPVPEIKRPALAAVAAFVGNTRLIDNILLSPGA
jgi:pantoate--beta-alanine ligase